MALGTPKGCRGVRGHWAVRDYWPSEGVGGVRGALGDLRECRYSGASSSIGASGGS